LLTLWIKEEMIEELITKRPDGMPEKLHETSGEPIRTHYKHIKTFSGGETPPL
jgi:hypothetical protein